MEAIIYKFVTQEDPLYQKGVALRISLFFKGMSNAMDLINDRFEADSTHLVAIQNDQVIGTGRLHIIGTTAIISQMTVAPDFQQQKIGSQILSTLMKKCSDNKFTKITLSARVTALEFYTKFGFTTVGNTYPSAKTGIIHQNMELVRK